MPHDRFAPASFEDDMTRGYSAREAAHIRWELREKAEGRGKADRTDLALLQMRDAERDEAKEGCS